MAVTEKQKALIMSMFGVASFIFGVVAEHKKPADKTPVPSGDGVICKYPTNPIIAWEYISVAYLIGSTTAAFWAMFCPNKGKYVPLWVLFQNTEFIVFFIIALFTTLSAKAMLLWQEIIELFQLEHNVHCDVNYECPKVENGFYGGGALLSLASSALWLVALMLADIIREDFYN